MREVIAEAARLFEPFSATARLDAELLMAHALGVERDSLLLRHLDAVTPPVFGDLLARRLAQEPVAYIVGTRAFWTIDLSVAPGVLVPRADSETLIEAAVDRFGPRSPRMILDLGTGSGALLLAALAQWPSALGYGVDRTARAVRIATANAVRLGMENRCRFGLGNWTDTIEGQFDLILANPPYIGTDEALAPEVLDHEPHEALFAGSDGLDAYRIIVPALPDLLAPGGMAVLEIGHMQGDTVARMVRGVGLSAAVRNDLGGRPRAVVAT